MSEKQKQGVVIKVRGRLSFPHLFERDSYKRYSANILIEPGSESDKAIGATINQVARNVWAENAVTRLKKFVADGDICYRNGDNKTDKDGNQTPGYTGMKYLTAVSPDQPTLLDELRNPVTKPEQGKLYGGADVVAVVEIWPQNGPKYYGIRCQLQGIQHFRDNTAFGGGRKASRDEFEDAPVNPDDDLTGDTAGNPDADIPL